MSEAIPLIPQSAPFSTEQRAWLNGFLAGLYSRVPTSAAASSPAFAVPEAPPPVPLTILYGSQTGTAESLARKAAKAAALRGFAATVADMNGFEPARIATARNVLVVTSTFGEGEPPDNAKALHTALAAAPANLLRGVRYSVCALGDSNYTHFCKCGREFDTWLENSGATRAAPRVDCDLDQDSAFAAWLEKALAALGEAGTPPRSVPTTADVAADTSYTKKNPFTAPLLAVHNLCGAGSAKQVMHVEFSLEGSGITYAAGDALGVYPQNCQELVGEVIAALGCDGEEAVAAPAGEMSLRAALTAHFDLGRPNPALVALLENGPAPLPAASPSPGSHVRDVLDLLRAAREQPALADFIAALKPLQPRLYSISSSPKAHPGQVHLTVGAVRYEANGRQRKGVCSTFLADRALAVGRARIFVHLNRNFHLTPNGDTPIIMVGPGTGIAPFRSFLEERLATGAKGGNWLFFGDRHAATDFLYREELETMRRNGHLTRLSLAWSRDQDEKIYVQQRMLEQAAELYSWLEAGAHFYVCGDASRMAPDVHAALLKAVELGGGKTPAAAADYVSQLQTTKRYVRDTY
ncbi:MAG: sulfite reductase subunit alpha [Opitutales bacterium]